jgi:hypothetical protein
MSPRAVTGARRSVATIRSAWLETDWVLGQFGQARSRARGLGRFRPSKFLVPGI